jgi:hypothetical protein
MFKFTDKRGENPVRGPVTARSKDGLMVNFRASFQYRLNKGGLVDQYMKYGEDYKTPCIKLAVDKMNEISS